MASPSCQYPYTHFQELNRTRNQINSNLTMRSMVHPISPPPVVCLLALSLRLSTESQFMEWIPSRRYSQRPWQSGLWRRKPYYLALALCGDITAQSFWNVLLPSGQKVRPWWLHTGVRRADPVLFHSFLLPKFLWILCSPFCRQTRKVWESKVTV